MNADEVQKLLKREIKELSFLDPAVVPNDISRKRSTVIIELLAELQRFEVGTKGSFVTTAAAPPRRKSNSPTSNPDGSNIVLEAAPIVQLVVGSPGLHTYLRTVLQRAKQLCELGHYRVALLACLAPLWSLFKADQSNNQGGITDSLIRAASANLAAAGMGGQEVERELRRLKGVHTLLQYLEQFPPFNAPILSNTNNTDVIEEDDNDGTTSIKAALSKKVKKLAGEDNSVAASVVAAALTPEAISRVAVGSWKMRRNCRELTEMYLLFSEARVLTAVCEFRILIETTDPKCVDRPFQQATSNNAAPPSSLLPDGGNNMKIQTPRTQLLHRLRCIGNVLEDVTRIDREDYYYFVYNTSLEVYNLCTTCFIPFAERHEEATVTLHDESNAELIAATPDALRAIYGENVEVNSLLHEAVMILTFVGRYCDSILPLATVRYVSWRVQIYTTVATCYEKQGDYTGALIVARYISDLVRELFELETGDAVPPAPDQLHELQAVTNRCRVLELKYSWAVRQRMESGSLPPNTNTVTQGFVQSFAALVQFQQQQDGSVVPGGKSTKAAAPATKKSSSTEGATPTVYIMTKYASLHHICVTLPQTPHEVLLLLDATLSLPFPGDNKNNRHNTTNNGATTTPSMTSVYDPAVDLPVPLSGDLLDALFSLALVPVSVSRSTRSSNGYCPVRSLFYHGFSAAKAHALQKENKAASNQRDTANNQLLRSLVTGASQQASTIAVSTTPAMTAAPLPLLACPNFCADSTLYFIKTIPDIQDTNISSVFLASQQAATSPTTNKRGNATSGGTPPHGGASGHDTGSITAATATIALPTVLPGCTLTGAEVCTASDVHEYGTNTTSTLSIHSALQMAITAAIEMFVGVAADEYLQTRGLVAELPLGSLIAPVRFGSESSASIPLSSVLGSMPVTPMVVGSGLEALYSAATNIREGVAQLVVKQTSAVAGTSTATSRSAQNKASSVVALSSAHHQEQVLQLLCKGRLCEMGNTVTSSSTAAASNNTPSSALSTTAHRGAVVSMTVDLLADSSQCKDGSRLPPFKPADYQVYYHANPVVRGSIDVAINSMYLPSYATMNTADGSSTPAALKSASLSPANATVTTRNSPGSAGSASNPTPSQFLWKASGSDYLTGSYVRHLALLTQELVAANSMNVDVDGFGQWVTYESARADYSALSLTSILRMPDPASVLRGGDAKAFLLLTVQAAQTCIKSLLLPLMRRGFYDVAIKLAICLAHHMTVAGSASAAPATRTSDNNTLGLNEDALTANNNNATAPGASATTMKRSQREAAQSAEQQHSLVLMQLEVLIAGMDVQRAILDSTSCPQSFLMKSSEELDGISIAHRFSKSYAQHTATISRALTNLVGVLGASSAECNALKKGSGSRSAGGASVAVCAANVKHATEEASLLAYHCWIRVLNREGAERDATASMQMLVLARQLVAATPTTNTASSQQAFSKQQASTGALVEGSSSNSTFSAAQAVGLAPVYTSIWWCRVSYDGEENAALGSSLMAVDNTDPTAVVGGGKKGGGMKLFTAQCDPAGVSFTSAAVPYSGMLPSTSTYHQERYHRLCTILDNMYSTTRGLATYVPHALQEAPVEVQSEIVLSTVVKCLLAADHKNVLFTSSLALSTAKLLVDVGAVKMKQSANNDPAATAVPSDSVSTEAADPSHPSISSRLSLFQLQL